MNIYSGGLMQEQQSPAKSTFRVLLLDADGTLIEGPQFFFNMCKHILENHLNTPWRYPSVEAFNAVLPMSVEDILREHGHGKEMVEHFYTAYVSYYDEHAQLFSWGAEFFKRAAQSYQLGICSNNDRSILERVFQKHLKQISVWHCRSESAYRKPQIEFYRDIERYGVFLYDCRYLTDEFLDAFRAKLAGVGEVGLVSWGHSSKDDLIAGQKVGLRIIQNLEDLYQFLEISR